MQAGCGLSCTGSGRRWQGFVWTGIVLAVTLSFGGVLTGCNKKTSGSRAAQVYISPEWADLGVETVAFLGVGGSTGSEPDRAEAERIVEEELRANQTRFIIVSGRAAESRAEATKEKYARVVQVWRDDRKVDQFLAKELCATMGVDGLILADLSDWSETRIDRMAEGTSWSRVGLGLYIYSGQNGLLVWGADRVQRKDSIPYRPSVDEGTVAAERRAEVTSDTPEPPPIDEVARSVIQELFQMFPPRA